MFGQKKKKVTKAFWVLYDLYIKNQNKELLPELSKFLSLIEEKDRDTQLLRPENGWGKILAWQVLRRQKFIFGDKEYYLEEGEILTISTSVYVIFLSRLSSSQFVMPGAILKPGYHLTNKDRGEISAHKWSHMISVDGLTDERGLYLPLYENKTVLKFSFSEAEIIKERVISFLQKEKGYVPTV